MVNQAFEVFKKAVVAIIDFLAEAVDKLIGLLQDYYNFILNAINLIVAGIIKIMEGLANLVSSAMVMPDNFMGQISEEFLGMDVTQPLPFEKTAMSEVANSGSDSEYDDLLGRKSYTENDFHVDPVTNNMELSPEILSQLQNSNGEINFGANENTLDTFKESVGGSEESEDKANVTEDKPVHADSYAEADWFIGYQNSQSPPSTDTENASGKQPANASSMSEEMKLVGPWTPGVRLYYLKEQMWAGIKKNWAENKWKYIGIGAAIVAGITALAILTAGAIFTLIPPALQIFAAVMMAAAVAKASGFFKTFMTEGWLGKTATAGKALARAIGIILVELIFILLFDSAALFKVLKTAAKSGVKGVANLAKAGVKSTLKAGKNAFVATRKGFVKQAGKAKFFVQGIGKGVAKGSKNLDELGENLAKRFKFKGFKIVVKGFRFYLYGSVNPWVLLASGDIEKIEKTDIISKGRIGEEIKYIKNGEEITAKLITLGDKIKYKKIFEIWTGETSTGKVIHHMIEQQMTGFVSTMTEAFINNARRLKGIPQGIINDVVHLRKIRTMWNEMYKVLKLNKSQMTDQQIVNSFINFANYTDELFEASFRYTDDMGESLTKDGLEEFTEQWLRNNPVDLAVDSAIENALR